MLTQRPQISPRVSQKTTATAHLAQTMSLLTLNNLELLEKIESELANNPALELLEERRCPTCNTRLGNSMPCPKCSYSSAQKIDEPIVFVSPQSSSSSTSTYDKESDTPFEEFQAQYEDLGTYVLQQIASELPVEDRKIAAHILASLDDDGLLPITKLEIARYRHASLERINAVLELISNSDPIGVGCQTPQEAMAVQLAYLDKIKPVDPILFNLIEENFDDLGKLKYEKIARSQNIRVERVKLLAEFISSNLNPYPARAHWGSSREMQTPTPQRYHKPDVVISCQDSGAGIQLVVEVLWPLRGILKVNPVFKKALAQVAGEKKEDWKADVEKAGLLLKCLKQRNQALVLLMELLAKVQKSYILDGDKHLQPITRAQLADEIGVHESTISRAVSGKSVQLPSGQIIPISKFFDRSLQIRTAIKEIVTNENKPTSDSKIVSQLEEQGYNVARRTVAKYRAMENIPPAHQRKAKTI